MPSPATWRSQRGFLLVEAALSAIVVAVGLVFVSRALSSELKAIQAVEESSTVSPLADAALRAMSSLVQSGRPPGAKQEGAFESPNAGYRWSMSAQPLEAEDAEPRYGMITLIVRRVRDGALVSSTRALWPIEYIPAEWL